MKAVALIRVRRHWFAQAQHWGWKVYPAGNPDPPTSYHWTWHAAMEYANQWAQLAYDIRNSQR